MSVRERLIKAGVAEPEAKARMIVAEALGVSFADLFLGAYADEAALDRIHGMARRCENGEPVEYVTGRAYFRYLTLSVSPDVLIPRHETELVAEEAIRLIRTNGYRTALDVCTGSGCIAISVNTETGIDTDACDISAKALEIAERNARLHGCSVRFFLSDMFASVRRRYDIIVSNPPYVSEGEYAALDASVRLYEPRLALAAGGDGLSFYRIIAAEAAEHLSENGALVLEIGAGQAKDVTKLLKTAGFSDVLCKKDYAGRDRIVTARRR